jgi:hypothetical protein
MRLGLFAVPLLALAACAPKVVQGNEGGGFISMHGVVGERQKAARVAQEECAKHGKVARISRFDVISDTVSYECVAKDAR